MSVENLQMRVTWHCILSKMPKRCKFFPSSDCYYRWYKASTRRRSHFASNALTFLIAWGHSSPMKQNQPVFCTSAPISMPSWSQWDLRTVPRRNDDADYLNFASFPILRLSPLCEECWVAPSNDKCSRLWCSAGYWRPVNFTKSIDSCGQSSSLAILNSDSKRAAARSSQ